MRTSIYAIGRSLGARVHGGLSFKSGQVAQLVEQRTENPCVGGSIPPLATTSRFKQLGQFSGWPFAFLEVGIDTSEVGIEILVLGIEH